MTDEAKKDESEAVEEIKKIEAIHLNGGVIKIEKIPGIRTREWMDLEENYDFSPGDASNKDKLKMKILHRVACMGIQRYDAKITDDHVAELEFFELVAVFNHVLSKRRSPDFTG